MMPECNADTVYFQHEPGKYIHLYFPHNQQLSAEAGHFFPPKRRYITGKQTEEDDSFYFGIKNICLFFTLKAILFFTDFHLRTLFFWLSNSAGFSSLSGSFLINR